jgi:hypothetical protein
VLDATVLTSLTQKSVISLNDSKSVPLTSSTAHSPLFNIHPEIIFRFDFEGALAAISTYIVFTITLAMNSTTK